MKSLVVSIVCCFCLFTVGKIRLCVVLVLGLLSFISYGMFLVCLILLTLQIEYI